MTFSRRNFLLSATALAPATALAANEWPQFRGVGARGVAADDPRLPHSWSETENIVWKKPVAGEGWSSPVVWGNRIFVASCVSSAGNLPPDGGLYDGRFSDAIPTNEHRWVVSCTDFDTGESMWVTVVHRGVPQTSRHKKNTYASETAVTDGEHVWAHFGDLGTYCLDMDGEVVWSKSWPDVETRYGYGTASSPVLHQGRLYIVNDNEGQSYLLALDKVTGREIWRVDRDEGTSWATPFIWENSGRTEIVTSGRDKIRSYDLDGTLLWELTGMSPLSIPSPFADDDLLYVASGYVGSDARPIYAIRAGASGDITLETGTTSNEFVAWSLPMGAPYHPTPLLYSGALYTLHDRSFFTCHDAATGDEIYGKQRIARDTANFTASPWAYNGYVFCLNEDGDTFVIKAGPGFKVVGRNSLGEMAMATPAIADGSLIVRTYSQLWRISQLG